MPRKQLLLVGGGHAHARILKRVHEFTRRDVDVTLLSPEEVHLYSGMAPGRLSGSYSRKELSLPIRTLVESGGGFFHKGWAASIDPHRKAVYTDAGSSFSYDLVSFNVGSRVPFERLVPEKERDAIGRSIFPAKPVACLDMGRLRLTSATPPRKIVVVGGGPGGCEIAANLAWDASRRGGEARVTLFAASSIVPRQNGTFRRYTRNRLEELGVEVREGSPVSRVEADRVLVDGESHHADATFLAIGVTPPTVFSRSGIRTGRGGGMLVDRHLRSTEHPEIFGGGDCIDIEGLPLDRVGVHAVRASRILRANLRAELFGGDFSAFSSSNEYLLICNLADDYGVGTKKGITARGSLVGTLKRVIDRGFVRSSRRLLSLPLI